MAMPFGDAELDAVYKECFKPAVEATGFDLWRLDEKPEAGIIDNNMVVAIRECRFLLAEVTHLNPGALWEAGFAEGAGKPVIYLCREKEWKDRHFDIAYRQSVKWDRNAPEEAVRNLKAAVRATFPADAIMEDE